jgi:translocation and assembly module TamB
LKRVLLRLLRGTTVLVAALALLVWGAYLVACHTPWGREGVRLVVLAQLEPLFRGQITMRELSRLGLGGVGLRGLAVRDPAGNEVIAISRLELDWAAASLLGGEIVVERVQLQGGRIELADFSRQRGVLAAFSPKSPEPEPARAPGRPLALRVREIEVDELALSAEIAGFGVAGVRHLALRASYQQHEAMAGTLASLSAELLRDDRGIGGIDSASGHYVSSGEPSSIQLAARLAETRLRLDARAHLPGDPAFQDAPLQAQLQIDRLEAATFAALGRSEWGTRLPEALDLQLALSGSARAPRATFSIGSAAGTLSGAASLSAERHAELQVSARQLALAQLVPGLPPGKLDGTLAVEAEHIDTGDVPIRLRFRQGRWDESELPELSASTRWIGEQLRNLSLQLTGYDGRLTLDGDVSFAGDVQAQIELALPKLERLPRLPGVPAASGALELHGHFGLRQNQLSVQGTLALKTLLVASVAVGSLQSEFAVQGDVLAPRVRTSLRSTGVRAGSIRLDDATLRLDARRTADARVVAALSAAGQLQGQPFQLGVERARLGRDESIDLRGARVQAFGQQVTLSGRYGAGRLDGLVLDARGIDLAQLRSAFALEPTLAGVLELHASARGSLAAPVLGLSLRGRELRYGEGPALALEADAELDAGRGRARVDAHADSAAGRLLSVQAKTSFPASPRASWGQRLRSAQLEAEAALERLDTKDLSAWLGRPLPVEGAGSLRLLLRGPAREPRLESDLRARLRQLGPGRDAELALQVRYAQGEARADATLSDRDGPWLEARAHLAHPEANSEALLRDAAQLLQRAAWDAQLQLKERRLAQAPIPRALPPAAGRLELAAQLSASHQPLAEPQAELKLQLRQPGDTAGSDCNSLQAELAVLARLDAGQLQGELELSRRAQQLASIHTRTRVELGPLLARLGPARLAGLELDLALNELDLATLPLVCNRVHGRISGNAHGRSLLEAAPQLELALRAQQLSVNRVDFMDATLDAQLRTPAASVELGLVHGATRSSLTARVPLELRAGSLSLPRDQPLSAELRLDRLPVGALVPAGGAISRATGTLSGRITLAGTRAAPELGGFLAPEGVGFTATALAQPLADINGRIAIQQHGIEIEQLRARDGDGQLQLDGRIDLRPPTQAVEAALTLLAKKFPLRQQGRVAGTLDAALRVRAALDEQAARVAVQMQDASLWLRSEDLRQGINLEPHPDVLDPRVPQAHLVGEPPPVKAALPLELSIEAHDSFWVRREDFAVKLSAQLTASSKQGQLRIRGPVTLQRGYLQLLGKVFELQGHNTLEFVGSDVPDPVLDITAQARSRGGSKVVTVKISGRARAPVLEFQVDQQNASAVEAAQALFVSGATSGSAKDQARSFVSGLSSGLLALSARSELGEVMPILLVEPGSENTASRVRAGFELDSLVPSFLAGVIRGVYVEGIFASGGGQQQQDTGGGVLIELFLPHDFVTSGAYGPGETWSLDFGWEP